MYLAHLVNLASVAHPCWGEVPIRIKDYPRWTAAPRHHILASSTGNAPSSTYPLRQSQAILVAVFTWSGGPLSGARAVCHSVSLPLLTRKHTTHTHPPQAHISLAVGVSFSPSPHGHLALYMVLPGGGTNYSLQGSPLFTKGMRMGSTPSSATYLPTLSPLSHSLSLPCPIFSVRTPSLFFIPHSAHTPEVPRPRLLQVRACSFLAW